MEYSKLFKLLKEKGYSTYRIRKEKIISEATLTSLRNNEPVSTKIICRLCFLLECGPSDIMDYIPDPKDAEKLT
jgi:putative transcriptional regulator